MIDFETVQPGHELPPLRKGPVTRQHLVEWCAAENDYFPLHYDERVAERMRLPGTPVQGTYRYALMGQLVESCIGPRAVLSRISANYRGLALDGEVLTARGTVTSVDQNGEGITLRMSVWVEGESGAKVAEGEALVRALNP
jgi:acyl dehydratase